MTAETKVAEAWGTYDAFLWWLVCGSDSGPVSVRQVQRCARALMDQYDGLRDELRVAGTNPYSPPPDITCTHDKLRRYSDCGGFQCEECCQIFQTSLVAEVSR